VSYQNVKNRLLIRPKVNPEESLQSYLIRLAQANGYKYSAFSSAITANSKPHRSFKADDRRIIQSLIAQISDPNAIELTDVWECASYNKNLFDYTRTKICLDCYNDKEILPPRWRLRNYLCCSQHKVLLIDCCSKCEEKFEEDTFVKGYCLSCELPINEMQTKSVPNELCSIDTQSMLDTFVGNTAKFCSFIDINLKQHYFNTHLCSIMLNEINDNHLPFSHRRSYSISELYDFYAQIFSLLNNGCLKNLICDYLRKMKLVKGKAFGTALSSIYSDVISEEGKIFKTEITNVLMNPPPDMSNWPVHVKWIEKFFNIPSDALKNLVTSELEEYELKIQGSTSISIKDVNILLSEYADRVRSY